MTIDVYSPAGTKSATWELPESLFSGTVNRGLIHQALLLQQGNRRRGIAHAKNRSEVRGSTRKLFQQKGTGRARRGPVRSPLLRGGGKAFGPRSQANFSRRMPRAMRHAAVRACLALHARTAGALLGLTEYPETVKTKDAAMLLGKLPVHVGRSIVFVLPQAHRPLMLSMRNIPGVQMLLAAYLNPEDLLRARHVIFVGNALAKAEEVFGKNSRNPKKPRKPTTKRSTTPSTSPASSDSSASSS